LWLGITRRRSIRIVLTILVANGALVALFGVIQRVAGNEKMFWVIEPPAKNFVATFLYKNHGGAYFNLLFAAACSLAWWYATRAERRLERTSPAPFFVFCAALIALIEVLSLSRAATLLMLAFLAVGAVAFVRQMARQRRLGNWPVLLLGGILTLAAIIGGARFLKADKAADRMQELFTRDRATSIEARQLTARATWEMALDRPVFGWGAGNYRFFFPLYQKRYPQILHPAWSPQSILLWEHAHNDYLEYLAELGVVGFLLLAAVPALWFRTLLRARPWRSPPLALLAFSIVLLLAHCWVDFNLQSPTILLTAAVIATLVARWSQLEIAQSART
jgi:O-antigen ligase